MKNYIAKNRNAILSYGGAFLVGTVMGGFLIKLAIGLVVVAAVIYAILFFVKASEK